MNIYEKLIEVRKSVPYLKKEHLNKHFNFKFVSSSQTLGALKDKMDELNLLLIPQVVWHNAIKGEKQILTEIEMEFKWINAENPKEEVICKWYSQGLDSGEKGPGKAQTYGEKFFLLKFFNIPTDEHDPDALGSKLPEKKDNASQSKFSLNKPAQKFDHNAVEAPLTEDSLLNLQQSKLLFAKTKSLGLTVPIMKSIIKHFGYTSSKDIKAKDLTPILDQMEETSKFKEDNSTKEEIKL